MRFAVLVLAFVVGACSPEGDTTGAISSCAQDLFPAYNPKDLDQCVAACIAAIGTIVTALSMGYIAHYEFGFSRQEIRTPAVVGAAVIGLLVATEYFGKKLRKPK